MKRVLSIGVGVSLIMFIVGCGGSENITTDNPPPSYKVTHLDGTRYSCPTSKDMFACDDAASCAPCTQIESVAPREPVITRITVAPDGSTTTTTTYPNSSYPQCTTSGTTVYAAEGQTCEDDGNVLSCKDGKVTLGTGFNATTITISGITYSCK